MAGFVATDERDVNYMDSFMDSLFDCMEQQNEEELLMRKYIDHIATFDAQEAKERTEHLEDLLRKLRMPSIALIIIVHRQEKSISNVFRRIPLPVKSR